MSGERDTLQLLNRRNDILSMLAAGITDRRELVSEAEVSRPTVDRGLRELESANLLRSKGSDYNLTGFGDHLLALYEDFARGVASITSAESFLSHLPASDEVPRTILAESRVYSRTNVAPYAPFRPLRDAIGSADRIQGSMRVIHPHLREAIYEFGVAEGGHARLVLDAELIEYLSSEYADEFSDLLIEEACELREWNGTSNMCVFTSEEFYWIGAVSEGHVESALFGHSASGRDWADARFDSRWRLAEEVTPRAPAATLD